MVIFIIWKIALTGSDYNVQKGLYCDSVGTATAACGNCGDCKGQFSMC